MTQHRLQKSSSFQETQRATALLWYLQPRQQQLEQPHQPPALAAVGSFKLSLSESQKESMGTGLLCQLHTLNIIEPQSPVQVLADGIRGSCASGHCLTHSGLRCGVLENPLPAAGCPTRRVLRPQRSQVRATAHSTRRRAQWQTFQVSTLEHLLVGSEG